MYYQIQLMQHMYTVYINFIDLNDNIELGMTW